MDLLCFLVIVVSSAAAIHEHSHRNSSYEKHSHLQSFRKANEQLYTDLMHGYRKELSPYYTNYHVEPSRDHPPPMETNMTLTFVRVVQVDQTEQVLKLIAEMRMIWTDHRLSWDPVDYENIEYIYINRQNIWVPEITVADSERSFELIRDYKQNVHVMHTGRVLHYYDVVSHSVCQLQNHDYPFDRQQCSLCMIECLFNKNESIIHAHIAQRVNLTKAGNGEWDVLTVSLSRKIIPEYEHVEFDHICFEFTLKRKSNFYVMVIIIPTFIITTLSIFGVFAKQLTGEDFMGELTLGLTSLMTLTVMLGIVADSLPKTNTLPVLSVFLTIEVSLTALSVLVVILHPRCIYPNLRKMRSKKPSSSLEITIEDEKPSLFQRMASHVSSGNLLFMLLFQLINFANLSYILSFWNW